MDEIEEKITNFYSKKNGRRIVKIKGSSRDGVIVKLRNRVVKEIKI